MFLDFKKDIENALINLEGGICLGPLTFLKPYSKWIRKNKIRIYIFIETQKC